LHKQKPGLRAFVRRDSGGRVHVSIPRRAGIRRRRQTISTSYIRHSTGTLSTCFSRHSPRPVHLVTYLPIRILPGTAPGRGLTDRYRSKAGQPPGHQPTVTDMKRSNS
jgi:hypothetical protein